MNYHHPTSDPQTSYLLSKGATVWRSQAVEKRRAGNLPANISITTSIREIRPSRRRSTGRAALPALVLVLVHSTGLLGFGCAQPRRTFVPEVDPATLGDVSFTHYLAQAPIVTVDEGLRAVLMLAGHSITWPTPEERHEELTRRGAVKPRWKLEPDQRLDFGTLAYMLRTICNLPRGINDVLSDLTGLGDRRAALRTCGFHDLLPHRLPHEPVTGGELLSAITAADAYLTGANQTIQPAR